MIFHPVVANAPSVSSHSRGWASAVASASSSWRTLGSVRCHRAAVLARPGLHLKAVKQLLDDTQGTVERLLSLRRTIAEPVALERSETVTAAELDELLGEAGAETPKLLDKLTDLGFILPIGSGHYEITSPSLLSAAGEALQRGISPGHVVELIDSLHRHAETISRRLVKNFVDDIWKPYLDSEAPDARWAEVAESIARLRPLGGQALDAMFTHTMGRQIDRALGDTTKRLSERKH